MKRKLLFSSNARRWNTLLQSFKNLFRRLKTGNLSEQQQQHLTNKLQNIFKRLQKLQYKVGIKLAGTAIAIMMFSAVGLAQDFSSFGKLTANNNEFFGEGIHQTFANIDGDSDYDLYVGDRHGKLYVFTNDGSGNFIAAGKLQADGEDIDVEGYCAPVFANIDGDSDLDLFVGESYGKIYVFTNDGSGNFTATGNLQADGSDIDVGYDSAPTFEDIDDDGDLDLCVGEHQGKIRVFINNGSGNFTAAGNLQADGSDIQVSGYSTPSFADIDNDSNLDLYVGEEEGFIKVYTNDGSGNFTAAGNLQADGFDINVGYYSAPVFAIIDNDSNLDLYIGEYYGSIKTFANDGNGNLTANGNLHNDGAEIDVGDKSSPVFAELNNDGLQNLYVGDGEGTIQVFANDGSGNFTSIGNLQADGSDIDVSYNSSPTFADIDDDGDMDLYVGEGDGMIHIFTNNGSGYFTAAGNLQADGSDINVGHDSSPVFANIDGDNDKDLYIGERYGKIKVFINDGNGNYTANGNLKANGSDIDVGNNSKPVFEDIDGDDDLDLYVGEFYGKIKIFTNDGNGNFTSAGNLQADGSDIYVVWYSAPAFADIDGDSDLDLILGEEIGKIYAFINDQYNNFTKVVNNSALSVHPNPSSGIFHLNIPSSFGDGSILVTDIVGRTIYQSKLNSQEQSGLTFQNFKVDLSSQVNGIYFIQCIPSTNQVINNFGGCLILH